MTKRLFVLFLLIPGLLLPGVIKKSVSFSTGQFVFTRVNGYDIISLPGQYSTKEKGKPSLPMVSLSVLVPPNAEITKVDVVSYETRDLPGAYLPYPVQTVRPLSSNKDYPFINPDASVYNSTNPYPGEIVGFVPTGCLAGYRIGGVILYPIQYLPLEKKLRLYTKIEFEINYKENTHESVSLTQGQKELFGQEVKDVVINPEAIEDWSPLERETRAGEVDYVIITNSTLAPNWNALKDWKTKKGIKTVVVRTDSIYPLYSGRDNQEKIRNFIIDWWQNRGLKYVLLGGDDFIVPDRKTRLVIEESTITGSIPTDMYYADLQWSWDGNKNNYFGEMQDTVDLFHDVYIGRAPVDNATNVATFITKDTTFEKRPDTNYVKSLLLPSQMLFSPYHGRVINNIIASYFPTGWKISRLEDPGSNATRDSLNKGYQFCHISAHGSYTSLSVLSISQISTLTNGIKYDIMNAINCDVGSFDGKDCIAESLVNYSNGGCIATMMNSRYGLGYPPGLGPSEMLDLDFFKCFMVSSSSELGVAHCKSKNNNRNLAMSQAPTRWCVYEQTLFGDPNLPMWSVKPRRLTVTHVSSISAGPQTFRVSVNNTRGPTENALVCVMKGTEVYAVGRTNSSGWLDLYINPNTTGTLSITVTARDCLPYEGTCSVTSAGAPKPCIIYQTNRIIDSGGNNNGRLDPGETADFYITLKNSGNANATNVVGKLRTTSSYITLIDSTSSYGNMNVGDTTYGDKFIILASPSTPQGKEIEFIVYTTASEGTWEPFLKTVVGVSQEPRRLWADHDTCICAFTVTTFGGFGTTYPYGEGSGFKYSKLSSYGNLYYGSMLAGTGPAYVADRFYGQPSSTINQDFKIVDTLKPLLPPLLAQEEYKAVYSDSGHPTPKGLVVNQWSLSLSPPGYDDWVIVCFDYFNYGTTTLNNFYSGMMFDFNVYNSVNNIARSDSVRRFIYMMRSTTTMYPTCGIRLLEPKVARNLSAIDHALYVEPASMMTEAVKDSFLSGKIKKPMSDRTYNWTICVSAGPFNIPANGKVRVVYAVIGGNDSTLAKVNSDSAQSWWDRNAVGIDEEKDIVSKACSKISIIPNPFNRITNISYCAAQKEKLTVKIFDVSGRIVDKIFEGEVAGKTIIKWQPKNIPAGIYFVEFEGAKGSPTVRKLVCLY